MGMVIFRRIARAISAKAERKKVLKSVRKWRWVSRMENHLSRRSAMWNLLIVDSNTQHIGKPTQGNYSHLIHLGPFLFGNQIKLFV